ncbi:MAG: uracil-DNA glycosylase [Clostridia bacterium]|nr:uracil-DNA glycosylase [Clostridia bacterium]MBR1685758.1 uracil-DNA glycosylase [Clostridia bacterium]
MPEISWELLHAQVEACTLCPLYQGITHKVPGQGDPHAPLMLIGEGPGQREDEEGLAFVGPAGQLLTRMLASISLPRDRVYICNAVKCRPPQNRTPTPEETNACRMHLRMQVALVRPRVILLLGSTALKATLGPDHFITRERGVWYERKGVWMMATYHPSALLHDASKKPDVWRDLQSLRDRLIDLRLYPDLYPAVSQETETTP